MQEILAKARDLGQTILASSVFKKLRDLEGSVLKDPEATRVIKEFEEAMTALQAKQERSEPISPEEKRQVQTLQEQVATNQDIQGLARAQAEYRALMEAVNEAIHKTLEAAPEDAPDEPSESRIILP